MKNTVRRTGFLAGMLGLSAVVVSGIATATRPFEDWPGFETVPARLTATYSYFTLWSNIIGTVVGFTYALGKRPRALAFLRIDAVVMLIVTGIIYNVILAKTTTVDGLYRFTNPITHILMPVLVPLVWLMDRFRDSGYRDVDARNAFYAMAIPALWAVYTFVRGETTLGYYPYDFINVGQLGYRKSMLNVGGVSVILLGLIGVMGVLEKCLNTPKGA